MPRLSEITDEQQAQVRELSAEGMLRDRIARRMGWTVDFFNAVRKRLELPERPRSGSRQHVPDPPSQAEIRASADRYKRHGSQRRRHCGQAIRRSLPMRTEARSARAGSSRSPRSQPTGSRDAAISNQMLERFGGFQLNNRHHSRESPPLPGLTGWQGIVATGIEESRGRVQA